MGTKTKLIGYKRTAYCGVTATCFLLLNVVFANGATASQAAPVILPQAQPSAEANPADKFTLQLNQLAVVNNKGGEAPSTAILPNYLGLEGEQSNRAVLPNNLSIPALIKLTLDTHPEVQSQLAALEGARANIKSAKWQYYPTPSLTYGRAFASEGDVNFSGDNNTYSLILEQPLWTGGRLKAGLDSAIAGKDISDAQLLNVRQSLALTLLQNYGDWLTAWLQQQALQTSLETHQKLYDQVARRKSAGLSTGADLALADGRLQSTKAQLAGSQAQVQRALSSLRQVTGFDLTSEMLAGAQQDTPEVLKDRAQAIELAVIADPSTQMAKAQVAAARAALKNSKSILKPELSVRLERTFGDFQRRNAGPDNRVVLGFNTRLGAGLSSLSGVDSAAAQVRAATAAIAASRRIATDRVLGDLALLDSFDARIKALLIALETAQEVSESYGRQFLAGRKSWLDRINSARDLQQAELQLSDALSAQLVVTWRIKILINGVDQVLLPTGTKQ